MKKVKFDIEVQDVHGSETSQEQMHKEYNRIAKSFVNTWNNERKKLVHASMKEWKHVMLHFNSSSKKHPFTMRFVGDCTI